MGTLSNEVAHEIKNPITAILCSAETLDLLIGDQIDEIHRSTLRYIKEYGDNLLRLVSDFLDVSRAETGHLDTKPMPTKIGPVVDSVVGLLESNNISKKITVNKLVTNPELEGYVDPNHLKQLIFNLLHNAIKFTQPDGEIRITVERDFPNPFVKVAVQDNGIGIPEDEIEELFCPYVQGAGQDPERRGTGIGLSLCKNLVELAGGRINVESTPGVGSSFEFTVPVFERKPTKSGSYLNAPSYPQKAPSGKEQPLTGQRFLLVDEDIGSREAISRLIEAWGGMVDKVTMAIEAVEALEEKHYDAVMIDDSLDGTFGFELARVVKEEMKLKETTVIVTTSRSPDEKLSKEAGVDQCIEKPLSGERLLTSLVKSGKYSVTH